MIKTLSLYISLFLLAASLDAQPLKKNVSPGDGSVAPDGHTGITLSDFQLRAYESAVDGPGSLAGHIRQKPGLAFLGSALVPGLGQAANKNWIRAGSYFAADILLAAFHFSNLRKARDREQRYQQFADENWSVVAYSKWLVDYHDQNNIQNPYIEQLRQQVENIQPSFNPDIDWEVVDVELLQNVERNTPFVSADGTGNSFSHRTPVYGSQQYYELISKYYQFGPGWMDFGTDRNGNPLDSRYQLAWNGTDMPFNFIIGSDMAESFNDRYRTAGNMLSLMLLNHIASAFDAYFTAKLNNSRLEAESNIFGSRQFTLRYNF